AVINALLRNTIDTRRAELIHRALHIAVKNARRAKFTTNSNAIREIPEYAEPSVAATASVGTDAFVRPASEASGTAGAEDELPAVAATTPKPLHPDPEFWDRWERGGQELKRRQAERQASASTAHVGADAFVRPASEASANVAMGASVGTAANVGADAFVRP